MMTRVLGLLLCCLVSAIAYAETISVSAAVSLKEGLTKIASNYKAERGEEVQFTFGSSGQLAMQISGGAPVDLFISAANKQVDELAKSGAIVAASRKVVAGNSLVLIVPSDSKLTLDSTKALADANMSQLAIGEPKTVPAGQYAEQALKHAGVYDAVKDRLILGTNVRQVLDYVERGEVSAGLVYLTDAKISAGKVRVASTVDAADHDPIVYPAVLVSGSKKQEAAGKFLDYLLTESAQKELRQLGFSSPAEPVPAPSK